MNEADLAALRDAYAGILRAADQLLPEPAELTADGTLLVARVGDSVAAGVSRVEQQDPDSLNAAWGALQQHRLRVQVVGPDPAVALDALLDQWDEHLTAVAPPGDHEYAAIIGWPSRYTSPVRALSAHGFGPTAAVAARTTARDHGGPPIGELAVRPLRSEDLDAAVPLYMQVIDFDAQFGMVTKRPTTSDRLRDLLVSVLDRDPTCAWIASQNGRPLGLCYVDLPGHADWARPMSRLEPLAYLGCLVVDLNARSTGIGSALLAEAHRAVAASGVAITLLHHSVPNPLSTPFWHRTGYRPLWTVWQRRPAVR